MSNPKLIKVDYKELPDLPSLDTIGKSVCFLPFLVRSTSKVRLTVRVCLIADNKSIHAMRDIE